MKSGCRIALKTVALNSKKIAKSDKCNGLHEPCNERILDDNDGDYLVNISYFHINSKDEALIVVIDIEKHQLSKQYMSNDLLYTFTWLKYM